MLASSTLRPGLLVALSTSVRGNVTYRKETLDLPHVADGGAQLAKWETERTIADPAEHERAQRVRTRARALISNVCAKSAFGLLCPESEAENLEKAMGDARRLADEFNSTAALSRVSVYIMTGRIAPDDVEAVKAINSEVRDLLSDMSDGLQKLDVAKVREAASRAKSIGSMLAPDAQARITVAIEAARSSARQIVKAGEQAAQEVDAACIRRIAEARTAFLDLDEGAELQAPSAAPGRAIDLAPDDPSPVDPGQPGATTAVPVRMGFSERIASIDFEEGGNDAL